ncbi:MAG: hypothetical protein IKM26_05095 [Clostridia bacterium]|nr:hypothetical protein [Clostridia bacterium]
MPNIVSLDMPSAYWKEKAQRARRAGDWDEAVRLYRAALRKNDDAATRRELAEVFAQMRSYAVSCRIYLQNLALDANDTDSLYGLARNYSLMGDENSMADLLDLYLRLAPCGEKADAARDILWRMPRPKKEKKRLRRAHTLYFQALDRMNEPEEAFQIAKAAWQRGHLPETAQLLSELYLRRGKTDKALELASFASQQMPDEMPVRLLLASALHVKGLHNACRAALHEAEERCQNHAQVALFCQQAMLLGCADMAVEAMEKRAEEAPGSAETLLLLVLALRALGGQEERVQKLLHTIASIDEEDQLVRALIEVPLEEGDSDQTHSLRLLQFMSEKLQIDEAAERDPYLMHSELLRLMRVPLPGVKEFAIRLMLRLQDEEALRLSLVEDDIPSPVVWKIVSALRKMDSPMPCFAKVDGKVCLLPPRERPPYDADLHDLVRDLLRELKDQVELNVLTRCVPAAWRMLPESARKHYSEEKDDVWLSAFAAYALLCAGNAEAAEARIAKSRRPLRVGRAYMQLIRRTKETHEVH